MNEIIHGFEIISKNPLPEFNAVGIYAKHKKTGLELYHILNDDDENFFSYNFMTHSPDSTGVAHIIEHTVLCGSKNYPLKDPFMVLAKQSVNTFLNAMTYPDKTVYPASSVVETDYFNLMEVYGDAVFFPNLDEWAFKQEGHRFEIDEKGKMTVQGVVLNEMRANYSDFDSVIYDTANASIFGGSIYEKDSGGSPLEIPDLTYEHYKAFYKKFYHPVNCRIFLMGNIPTEKQLKFLEEKFLSHFDKAEKPQSIPPITKCDEPKFVTAPAPSGESGNTKNTAVLTWLFPEIADTVKLMESYLIGELLIGHNGAYLNKALIESKIAEDLYPYNGIGKSMKNITFMFGIKGLEKNKYKDFKKMVFDTLEKLVSGGIDQKEIETAVHAIDFSNREIKRNYGPFAITLMERAMTGWQHGKGPEDSLQYIPAFKKVKTKIKEDKNYIPNLIKKYLIENKHYTILNAYPDKEFCKRLDESLEKRAAEFDKTLTKEKREAMLKEQEILNKFKETQDSIEKLSLIPHLSKKDLPPLPPEAEKELEFINGIPVIIHQQPTNGIAYFELAFPIDNLSKEDYNYIPLLSSCITGMGTSKLSWSEAASEAANLLGGLSAGAAVFTLNEKAEIPILNTSYNLNGKLKLEQIAGRDWIIITGKMLGELIHYGINFIFKLLAEISFDDTERLKDIITQRKNDFESLPALEGNTLAMIRASACFSEKNAKREILSGITQIKFLRTLYKNINKKTVIKDIGLRLKEIYSSILKSGLFINIIGTNENIKDLKKALEENLNNFSAPALKQKIEFRNEFKFNCQEKNRLELIQAPLQVGFAVSVFKSAAFASKEHSAEAVLCRWLSTPLWEKIRSIGGAYGAYTVPMSLDSLLAFVTYRDPNPVNSLSEFLNSINQIFSENLSKKDLEKIITGRYSREIMPQTPSGKGFASFKNILCGISYRLKKEYVTNMINTTYVDLISAAKKLSEQKESLSSVILASETSIKNTESVNSFLSNKIYSEKL